MTLDFIKKRLAEQDEEIASIVKRYVDRKIDWVRYNELLDSAVVIRDRFEEFLREAEVNLSKRKGGMINI